MPTRIFCYCKHRLFVFENFRILWVTLVKVLLAILFDGPFLNNHCNVNFEQVVSVTV